MQIFRAEKDYDAFRRVVEETLRVAPIRICAYCWMPNSVETGTELVLVVWDDMARIKLAASPFQPPGLVEGQQAGGRRGNALAVAAEGAPLGRGKAAEIVVTVQFA